jgi:hypothetical protein
VSPARPPSRPRRYPTSIEPQAHSASKRAVETVAATSSRDLTGRLDLAIDEVTSVTPTDPTYREGVSIWVWDDAGRFGFPRIGVEAVGRTWTERFATALCFGRPGEVPQVFRDESTSHPVFDAGGRPRVLGAGPLRFECIEPFVRWRVTFVHHELTLELDAQSVTPPWVQGMYVAEGHHVPGESRFEQLCTVVGTVRVGGIVTRFSGGGLRIHRKGGNRSDYGDFYGHNWQSARFASGRAFGFMHYRPRPDGTPKYREGWLLDDGRIVAARVEDTPWMTDTQPSGEDVSFTLHTADRSVRIAGETFVSSFRPPRPIGDGTTFPLLHSGIARYDWDGEAAYGMIERSARDL